jgi:hypothetical protein
MVKKNKKTLHKFPSFQPAVSLDLDRDDAQTKASYYREKAKVRNTEKSTKNWITKFEEFRVCANYSVPLSELDDVSLLQQQLVECISTMKRNDGCEYKATSIKQAVDALNRYLVCHSPILRINLHDKYMFPDLHNVLHGKMCDLQEHGFGETSGSVAINPRQILQILQHPRMNTSSPEGLLYRIFFQLSIILAMRGGEHYDLKIDQFKSDGHDGLQFFRYTSKNNQRGIQGGKAQIISIPADDSGPCTDIKYYLSKRPDLSDDNFYLQPNPSWLENGIWYKTSHIGKNRLNKFMQNIGRETQIDIPIELLSNHSGRKTATQVLQDEEIPEQAIMQLTGHKSVQGVRAYKTINEEQQLNTLKTLINITDDKLSSKQNNSSSQDNSINDNVEITKSRVPLQEISLSANSLGNEIPIFQNCTFSNVSFYIQK